MTFQLAYESIQLAYESITRNLFAAIPNRIVGWRCRRRLLAAYLRWSVVMAEKCWSQGASPSVTSAARRQSSVSEHGSSHANQETRAVEGKADKNSLRASRGGARVVTILATASPDRF
jgi:hypothetical protein